MSYNNTDHYYSQNFLQAQPKYVSSQVCTTAISLRSQVLKPNLDPDTPFSIKNLDRGKISDYTKPELRKLSLCKEDQVILIKLHSTEKRRVYTQTHREKEANKQQVMKMDIDGLVQEKESLIVEKLSLKADILFYKVGNCSHLTVNSCTVILNYCICFIHLLHLTVRNTMC